MKKFTILILIPWVLLSCIEQLEPIEPRFEKVYGFSRDSYPEGITMLEDGSMLLYGRAARQIMEMSGGGGDPNIIDALMPLIIRIDQNGNELITKTYPFDQIIYQSLAADSIPDEDGIYQITSAGFSKVYEMPSGKFFAAYYADNKILYHEGYMILDQNLKVEKVTPFNDSSIEFQDTFYVYRGSPEIISNFGNSEILVLLKMGFFQDEMYNFIWSGFYSIMKIDSDGNIIEMFEFNDNVPIIAEDITLDKNGNVVVLGNKNYGR